MKLIKHFSQRVIPLMSERTDNTFLFYLIQISLCNSASKSFLSSMMVVISPKWEKVVIMLLSYQMALGSLLKSTLKVIIARQMILCICFQLKMIVLSIDVGILGNGKALKLCYAKGKNNRLTFLELCLSAPLLLNNKKWSSSFIANQTSLNRWA